MEEARAIPLKVLFSKLVRQFIYFFYTLKDVIYYFCFWRLHVKYCTIISISFIEQVDPYTVISWLERVVFYSVSFFLVKILFWNVAHVFSLLLVQCLSLKFKFLTLLTILIRSLYIFAKEFSRRTFFVWEMKNQ